MVQSDTAWNTVVAAVKLSRQLLKQAEGEQRNTVISAAQSSSS